MTGPREWRHAEGCMAHYNWPDERPCICGLSAVRDAIDAGQWRPTVTDWVDTVPAECCDGCMRSGIDGWLYPSVICWQHWPMGTCAGPSWEAHEPFKVATGNPCPRCGTVMP